MLQKELSHQKERNAKDIEALQLKHAIEVSGLRD